MTGSVVRTVRDAALWVTLDRPDALNSIDETVLGGLERAFDEAETDDAIRSVVIAANGRAFCAGADLTHVLSVSSGSDALHAFLERTGVVFDRIEAFPKPVIAAVHGMALAGGLELVLVCDLVVAARSAQFGDAHANYGLLPGAGGSVRLPRRVGRARAKALMFTGRPVPAAELAHTDLVTHLVDDAELEPTVSALTARIAETSPLGLRRMKRLVDDGLGMPVREALRAELDLVGEHTTSADFAEGLAAFQSRRRPLFTGR